MSKCYSSFRMICALVLSFFLTSSCSENNSGGETFIKGFYDSYIWGPEYQNFGKNAKELCSDALLQRLRESYDYECDDDNCYALWEFRTSNQDGPSNISEIRDITSIGKGWYLVRYIDMGHEGATAIELKEYYASFLINDMFNILENNARWVDLQHLLRVN